MKDDPGGGEAGPVPEYWRRKVRPEQNPGLPVGSRAVLWYAHARW